MDTSTLIIVLGLVTLLAALAIDYWQKACTREAEKTNRHSALSEPRPERTASPHGSEPESVARAHWIEENR